MNTYDNRDRAPALRRFSVTFTDWTAYRLEIDAESAEQAVEIAQSLSTDELWQAEACDGGQENWEAFPVPAGETGGAQ